MRSGWNPTRRNRNIGTTKQGHGQDNKLVIPARWPHNRVYWEALSQPVVVSRDVGEERITFLVEPTIPGFVHACTIDDLCEAWSLIDPRDRLDLDLIILRQPKRKEVTLAGCWGRLAYYADVGIRSGTAIFLEAQELGTKLHWRRSQTPAERFELDRLRSDGHVMHETPRHFVLPLTLDATRATQLYRTLFHEVGHYVDWLRSALDPHLSAEEAALYDTKPSHDKEAFAHRYADELRARLTTSGALPFPRRLDGRQLARDGLEPAWFAAPPPARG